MSIDELNAAKQALGVQTDKELAKILGVEIASINNYRIRGIPQKLRTLIMEKRLEKQQQSVDKKPYMSDFEGLVEEMKEFFGVNSLEAVAEKMGYSRNTAANWRYNKKLSAHAQLMWLEAKQNQQKVENEGMFDGGGMSDFKALVEEMKKFYGVSSLEAVAEKMGYSKNIAMGWRRNKKLSAHAQLKWLEAKGELGEITENFDELTREMQAFYGVNSLEAVAEKMGYHPHNAIKWRKNNKLTPHAQLKWLEVKQNRQQGDVMIVDRATNERSIPTANTANFAFLLDFYGCKTLKQLAQKMGFDPKNISDWRVAKDVPQHVLLKFEIDKRCANGQPIGDALASVMQAKTICVNYYPSLSISAGYGIVANEAAATRVELQKVLLEGLMIENVECLNIVNVCGDSMLPILHDGDKILVEHNCAARNGDCVVAIIENELVVKELERHPLGHWVRLHSKNEKYRDIELEGQEVEKMRIVGIVRAIIRTMGRKV